MHLKNALSEQIKVVTISRDRQRHPVETIKFCVSWFSGFQSPVCVSCQEHEKRERRKQHIIQPSEPGGEPDHTEPNNKNRRETAKRDDDRAGATCAEKFSVCHGYPSRKSVLFFATLVRQQSLDLTALEPADPGIADADYRSRHESSLEYLVKCLSIGADISACKYDTTLPKIVLGLPTARATVLREDLDVR